MSKHPILSDCAWLDLEPLDGASVLITGATGLVGCNIIRELSAISAAHDIRILALVRNIGKAEAIFSDCLSKINFIEGDITKLPDIDAPVDYIIHGASVTSSRMFVENPVETIMTSVMGTVNMLELARRKHTRSMVYLSSMEVYGSPTEKKLLTESAVDYLDPLKVRSSYPESKRMCESLCAAYAHEYSVNVCIARLAQTFGPGMLPDDKRAIVQFVNSALDNKDISIKASGESARMYLYAFDAVSAIITLLLKGESASAYNIANKETYCSIKELAEHIVSIAGASCEVLVNTGSTEELAIYPPDSFLLLDTSRLERLGWRPEYSLQEGLRSLIEIVKH